MKEFIEKLIGRLEEKFKYNSEQAEIYRDGSDKDAYFREKKDLYMDRANTYGEVMRIVNELAEEYKNANIITDFLQYARDNADNYDTNEGWSLADLIDLSIKFTEEYSAKTPQNSAVNPTTNADRIRSMTDEELAEFFEKLEVVCDMCAFKVGCCNIAPDNCKSGLLKWLQSEAEGVTENE